MKFAEPLKEGIILKRYKRFLADIDFNGEVVVAHTANTGSMRTCWEAGWPVLCSFHDNPKRKLKYSLEMTHNGKSWICVNTSLPNKLGAEAILNGTITELQGYQNLKPEAKIGESRIDILLSNGEEDLCYVEIKNVTLVEEENIARFPDAVTTRGQKHLRELTQLAKKGTRACMLYIVNREDAVVFEPAALIDPEYAMLLKEAESAGVEILVYQASLTPESIELKNSLPYRL
ncbi:MAG: DNA/RNA nuclease SfsA [Halobacteriovoraceae bacterium]|nr:DNA/RNA nuclease SfsA [Halobacteriovoraceae bacterium]MBT5094313.1 DNA/RNA nuclease SfsA [Halobacteriovoraceae bacterium]